MSAPSDHEIPEADALLLSAYVDGELSPAERSVLEQRLQRESALRTELEALRAHGAVLKSIDSEPGEAASQPSAGFVAFKDALAQATPDEIPVAPALPVPRVRRALFILFCFFGFVMVFGMLKAALTPGRDPELSNWRLQECSGKCQVERNGRMMVIGPGTIFRFSDVFYLESAGETAGTAILSGPNNAVIRTESDPKSNTALQIKAGNAVRFEEGRFSVEASTLEAAEALTLSTPDGRVTPEGSAPWKFEITVKAKK